VIVPDWIVAHLGAGAADTVIDAATTPASATQVAIATMRRLMN
jgi:hypothetical protein